MCFMMDLAAGGMRPISYALLAEMMPSRHRGWALVLVGGVGAVGGYFAASAWSALLQPTFGWRILWLINLPAGMSLVLIGRFIPESAKSVLARGRVHEAEAVMRLFGSRQKKSLAPARAGGVFGLWRADPCTAGWQDCGAQLLRARMGTRQFRSAPLVARRSCSPGLFCRTLQPASRRVCAQCLPHRIPCGTAL